MPTNHYFNQFSGVRNSEQSLYEDLIVESIQIMGHDVYYLPRESIGDIDTLFGENVQSRFEKAYVMEMYIANVEGWEGDGDFFSKFGLELRQGTNFVLAKRTFDKHMPTTIAIRPREGDLIYAPTFQQIFEIKFVEEELFFFALGKRTPYVYELQCEVFRYSSEKIDTGVEEIDNVDTDASYTIALDVSGQGDYMIGEIVYQGANLSYSSSQGIVNEWDRDNRRLYIYNIKGEFSNTSNVIGVESGISSAVLVSDTLGDNVIYDQFDNKILQNEANTFIDFGETNLFGKP